MLTGSLVIGELGNSYFVLRREESGWARPRGAPEAGMAPSEAAASLEFDARERGGM